MLFLAAIGAIFAGLFLTLRGLLPWLAAARSGVIRTQGSRPQKIERATEPDRFKALNSQRLKSVWPGLLCMLGGIGFIGWSVLEAALSNLEMYATKIP